MPTAAITSTLPAGCAGARAVQVVLELQFTWVAFLVPNSKLVAEPVAKPTPTIVTVVAPATGPPGGVTLSTFGV